MNDNLGTNTMEDRLIDFIYEIERDCERLSQDIISRLCKRAIKKLNKFDSSLAGKTDDYPSSFKFCDVLSVELQSSCYEEINPFLRDFIDNTLYDEYNELSQVERFIVDHSVCAEKCECDCDAVLRNIDSEFHKMLDEQYYTKKIQHFVERWY